MSAKLQEAFGLPGHANVLEFISYIGGGEGINVGWHVDSDQFPKIAQFLLDLDERQPSSAHAIDAEKLELGDIFFIENDDDTLKFGEALLHFANNLSPTTILRIAFEDPSVSVDMCMPEAVVLRQVDPEDGRDDANLFIEFDAAKPPQWIASTAFVL